MTVRRKVFQAAIEAGIRAYDGYRSSSLTDAEKARLREIGKTARVSAVGSFEHCCPAVTAKLKARAAFAFAFDDFLSQHAPHTAGHVGPITIR